MQTGTIVSEQGPVWEGSDWSETAVYVDDASATGYPVTSRPPASVGVPVLDNPLAGHHMLLTEREILRRLSHDLKQTMPATIDILRLVYKYRLTPQQLQYRIARYGLRINHSSNNPEGKPGVVHKRRKQQPILVWFDSLGEAEWRSKLEGALRDQWFEQYVPRMHTPDMYLLQEIMLASVNDYTTAYFNDKVGAFSSSEALDPSGASAQDREWKYISDRVWGAGSLMRQGQVKEAIAKLNTIYDTMKHALETDSVQMLVRIWRICRYLIGMGNAVNDSELISRHFLKHFRDLLAKEGKEHTPACRLFDALSKMTPDSLMYALRIGHLRAMESLEYFMGSGHPVVLSMWVYYSNQWKLSYKPNNTIVEYYTMGLETADRGLGPTSDAAISIFHDNLYFVYYNIHNGDDEPVYHLALDLYNRLTSAMGPGPFTWNTKTQYLTFASQILARIAHKLDHRELAQRYLENVIELLRESDTECRVRASKLLRQLATWLYEWNNTDELLLVEQEERRVKETLRNMIQPCT